MSFNFKDDTVSFDVLTERKGETVIEDDEKESKEVSLGGVTMKVYRPYEDRVPESKYIY